MTSVQIVCRYLPGRGLCILCSCALPPHFCIFCESSINQTPLQIILAKLLHPGHPGQNLDMMRVVSKLWMQLSQLGEARLSIFWCKISAKLLILLLCIKLQCNASNDSAVFQCREDISWDIFLDFEPIDVEGGGGKGAKKKTTPYLIANKSFSVESKKTKR